VGSHMFLHGDFLFFEGERAVKGSGGGGGGGTERVFFSLCFFGGCFFWGDGAPPFEISKAAGWNWTKTGGMTPDRILPGARPAGNNCRHRLRPPKFDRPGGIETVTLRRETRAPDSSITVRAEFKSWA